MSGKVVKTSLKGHKDSIASITSDHAKGILISASDDESIRLWDVRVRNASIRLFRIPKNDCDINACHTAGDLIVVTRGGSLFGYDMRFSDSIIVPTPSFSYSSKSPECELNDFGFSTDASFIAAPTDDGDVEVVCMKSFTHINTIQSLHANIASVARYMPNDKNLMTTGYDCFVSNTKVSESYKLDKRIGIGSLLPPIEEDGDPADQTSTQSVNPPFGTCMETSSDASSPNVAVGAGDGSVLVIPSKRGKPDFRSISWGGANVHSVAVCGLSWGTSDSSIWSVGNDSVLINMDPDRIRIRYPIGWKPNSVTALTGNKVAIAGLNTEIDILEFL